MSLEQSTVEASKASEQLVVSGGGSADLYLMGAIVVIVIASIMVGKSRGKRAKNSNPVSSAGASANVVQAQGVLDVRKAQLIQSQAQQDLDDKVQAVANAKAAMKENINLHGNPQEEQEQEFKQPQPDPTLARLRAQHANNGF